MVKREVQHLDSEGLYNCVLRAMGGRAHSTGPARR